MRALRQAQDRFREAIQTLDLPLRGMKAKVKYHIPLRGMKARVEYHSHGACRDRPEG
ncbi:MAG: hypothetical protein IIB46_01785 [Nitrospinae bacterium]|nr:hypothetical protein [Nitrospinota bacterium]